MKPYYYTFEWKNRLITLCLVYLDGDYNLDPHDDCIIDLHMGYSVKLPEDTDKPDFAKKIALGRACKHKTSFYLGNFDDVYDYHIRHDKGFLKAIAKICERNIKKGEIVIKGIR